jgi:hypothetical protein
LKRLIVGSGSPLVASSALALGPAGMAAVPGADGNDENTAAGFAEAVTFWRRFGADSGANAQASGAASGSPKKKTKAAGPGKKAAGGAGAKAAPPLAR